MDFGRIRDCDLLLVTHDGKVINGGKNRLLNHGNDDNDNH
jgi:hypothetical protein